MRYAEGLKACERMCVEVNGGSGTAGIADDMTPSIFEGLAALPYTITNYPTSQLPLPSF